MLIGMKHDSTKVRVGPPCGRAWRRGRAPFYFRVYTAALFR